MFTIVADLKKNRINVLGFFAGLARRLRSGFVQEAREHKKENVLLLCKRHLIEVVIAAPAASRQAGLPA